MENNFKLAKAVLWKEFLQDSPFVLLKVNIEENLSDKDFASFLELVEDERKSRISLSKSMKRRNELLAGGLLLQLVLNGSLKKTDFSSLKELGEFVLENCKRCDFKLSLNENGKPAIAQNEDLHFNITHTGGFAFLAISKDEIGIDGEKLRVIQESIEEKFFNESENMYLKDLAKRNFEEYRKQFIKLWTRKEALCKISGGKLSDYLKVDCRDVDKIKKDYNVEVFELVFNKNIYICLMKEI